MDNNDMHQDDGRDSTPAAQHGTGRGGRRVSRGRLIAGTALASVLAAGAAFGAVTVMDSGPAAASPAGAGATGPAGQAAVLSSALSAAAEPATAASTTTAAARHRLRDPLARLRRLGGIDGQFTFETKAGPKTIAFERGTIQSVSGSDVVVRAKDGTTWTWVLVGDSVVRQDGRKTTASALSAGELVFAGGPVASGTHDARLIVIRQPRKATSSGTPSTSTNAA